MEWGGEKERERSGVQSLPTAWIPISLQHGTYLSSASHAHEHLTLRFVKDKKQQKIEAQSMLAHQGGRVQSIPHTSTHSPPFSMHCPPTDNHSAPRHKYFMTLNKAQHIREEQNGTSPSEHSQLSPNTHREPYSIVNVSAWKPHTHLPFYLGDHHGEPICCVCLCISADQKLRQNPTKAV